MKRDIEPKLILCVDDNQGDLTLLKTLFKDTSTPFEIATVTDGSLAIDYLFRQGAFEGSRTPDLVLLDLNLPKMDGKAVLTAVKSDQRLKKIPILMLTSSTSEVDIAECYHLGANAFIPKPLDMEGFQTFVEAVESFWLKVARLPPPADTH